MSTLNGDAALAERWRDIAGALVGSGELEMEGSGELEMERWTLISWRGNWFAKLCSECA